MADLTRATFWAVALTAALSTGAGLAEEKPKKPTVMQRKLINAQLILEGLALSDHEKTLKGADGLMLCVRDAAWRAIKAPKYEVFSNEFISNIESLKKAAKKKNNEAAALAYVEITLTCVKCHQYMRDERMGAAPVQPRALAHVGSSARER